ncbi:DUF4232 domain-containing protein [Kitasatospora sp. NBC_00458]|uniref:DUF4232 domain-containing protein n=1 Tax=Kitasatospora sp. NBC_00458 TaxID=2903568 RepID=UPI002E16DA2B
MRTVHHRTTALAAAGTAVLALALTACGGNGSGSTPTGAAAAPTRSAAGPGGGAAAGSGDTGGSGNTAGAAQAPATGTGGGPDTGGTPGPAKSTGAGNGPGPTTPGAAAPACTTKDVAVTAALQGGPPHTHIVLTARNTSGHGCRLVDFPQVRFLDDRRGNVPAVAGSKPAAPVTLDAGAPAYAVVKLSDGRAHEDTEAVTSFSVTLAGGGGQVTVKAPGPAGIAVDPAAWATGYWTPELRNGADEF